MSDRKEPGSSDAKQRSGGGSQKTPDRAPPRTPSSPGRGRSHSPNRAPGTDLRPNRAEFNPAPVFAVPRANVAAAAVGAPPATPSTDRNVVPPSPQSEVARRRGAGAAGARRGDDVRGMPARPVPAAAAAPGTPHTPRTPQSSASQVAPRGGVPPPAGAAAVEPSSDKAGAPGSSAAGGDEQRIWLTNIDRDAATRAIREFLLCYYDGMPASATRNSVVALPSAGHLAAAAALTGAGAAAAAAPAATTAEEKKKARRGKSRSPGKGKRKGKGKGKAAAAAAEDADADMPDAATAAATPATPVTDVSQSSVVSPAPAPAPAVAGVAAPMPVPGSKPPPGVTPKYLALLYEAHEHTRHYVNINAHDIWTYNQKLYSQLQAYPNEFVPLMDVVLNQERERYSARLLAEITDPAELADAKDLEDMRLSEDNLVSVRPFNLLRSKGMRDLNPSDIDTLVSVKGMVIRCGGVIPDMVRGFFQCSSCAWQTFEPIRNGRIREPVNCDNCKQQHCMQLVHNRCSFTDKQVIKVQEQPDTIPEGETPQTIRVMAFRDLVDVPKPGDRIEITAVYKAASTRLNPRKRTVKSVFQTYLDAVHIKKNDANRFGAEDAAADKASEFYTSFDESAGRDDEQERIEMEALNTPGLYQRLMKSLAPSIWEMDDVKKGVLCQLFGGANLSKGAEHGRFRGELNILLCGDPGTSKSQLLQYVHKLAPRGIYTSGKGSSAVGLTASVVKDPESRELVLESGALVLSDRGICCIDEFDKMNDATRSILHEVMEQQTVSIAKAGIVCTLNARTSILASANPQDSRYNPRKSVVQNLQLPPTLLSRFDLIYLILDQPNEEKDRRLARHLVGLYHEQPPVRPGDEQLIPTHVLTRYISYARTHCYPKLSDEAAHKLIEQYVTMRARGAAASGGSGGLGGGGNRTITATPRQLEALIRLSEALARMRLSADVTEDDVTEAIRLMEFATQTAATDSRTGLIDMDLVLTGVSSTDRRNTDQQLDALQSMVKGSGQSEWDFKSLHRAFNEQSNIKVAPGDFEELIHKAVAQKLVVRTKGQSKLKFHNF